MGSVAAAERTSGFAVSRTLIVGASAIALLLALGALLSTWTDEEYSLITTAHGVAYAYAHAVGFEKQGPLYFVVLAAWRAINASVFFARMLSVVCIAGFLAVAAALLRRIWPQASTVVFAAIAFNPFVVYAGVEIRLYASALFVSALLALFFFDGFLETRGSLRARAAFVITALAAAYLQYYLMFALVGFGAALLVLRRPALPRYLAACAVIACGMLPLVSIVRAQIGVDEPSQLGALAALRIPLAGAADYVLPLHWARGSIGRIAYLVLGAIALGSLVAAKPQIDRRTAAFAGIAGVLVVLFTLVGLIAHVFVIAPRQTVVLFVPLVLFVASLLATARRPRAARGFGAAYALAALLSLASLYGHGAKTGDWSRVGSALNREVRAGDLVAVFDADTALPLSRYYSGSLIRLPRVPPADVFRADAFVIHSAAQIEAKIGSRALPHRRLWLVRNNACTFRNPDYGCAYLDRVVAHDYRIVAERSFFESSIAELAPR